MISLRAYNGSYLTSVPRAVFPKDSYSWMIHARSSWQTDGSQAWHKGNGRPALGVGAMWGNSGSRQYIGNLAAVYGFVDYHLLSARTFGSDLSIGFGPAWVQKPFNALTNPKNLLLGSRINFLMHFELMNRLRLSERFSLLAGVGFTHLSNGRYTLPNLGLNIPSFSAGLQYRLREVAASASSSLPQALGKFEVQVSAGGKQTITPGTQRFLVLAGQALGLRKIASQSSLGLGVFFNYDGSYGDHYNDSLALNKAIIDHAFNAAVLVQFEQHLGRLSIPVNAGVYLREAYYGKRMFQQFGLRYHFLGKYFSSFMLKTHGGVADYMHLGLGVQL